MRSEILYVDSDLPVITKGVTHLENSRCQPIICPHDEVCHLNAYSAANKTNPTCSDTDTMITAYVQLPSELLEKFPHFPALIKLQTLAETQMSFWA